MKMTYKIGEEVWVKISWAGDDDCWVKCEVLKVTPKRVKVLNSSRAVGDYDGIGYYSHQNIKKI